MTTTEPTAFDRATAVHAAGDGRFTATLDPDWDGPFERPNGGVIAAILLRGAQAELAAPISRRGSSLSTTSDPPATAPPS